MADELEIINNPDSTPVAVSTGYQAQNTRAVADSNGIDCTVVEASGGSVILRVSGPVDVNGTLYKITTEATLTPTGAGNWFVYLESGSAGYLTPKLTNSGSQFVDNKNAHYTSSNERILNWLIQHDGTNAKVFKVGRDKFDEWITSAGTWTCLFSKMYDIWVTGKGARGSGGSVSGTNNFGGSGGGGGATSFKQLYINAGDSWTSVFSTSLGGNTSFSNGTSTIIAQNGGPIYDSNPGAKSGCSGYDQAFSGQGGGRCDYKDLGTTITSGGPGGSSIYGGGGAGRLLSSGNGLDADCYGAGGGGCLIQGTGTASGGSGGMGVIRIIG